jgi:hypothetical protein
MDDGVVFVVSCWMEMEIGHGTNEGLNQHEKGTTNNKH